MRKLFEKYNINLTEKQENHFRKYYDLLIEYNQKFNITAITDKEEVINKHFIDSVLGVDKVCGNLLIDVGSGGGFPAIPIKIMRDDISLTLVEATGKKCQFLNAVIDGLKLENVTVLNMRAEDLGKDLKYREAFDCCTARAVARLNSLCEYCMPLVKVGGTFLAYKGDADEEVKEAQNAIKILGGSLSEHFRYELENAQRALISIKKIKNTDKKYPRGNGKERKNPL